MITYLVFGATYAFAAAVQPGPLQTYLISQTVANGWRRTLPAALSVLLSDGPIILLVLLVLNQMPTWLEPALRLVGGMFLLFLAWGAYKTWRTYQGPAEVDPGSTQRSIFQAALVNLLNPNPYIGWMLVMGPLLLQGWRESPLHGIALLVGFYATLVCSLAVIITVFGSMGSKGRRIGRALVGLSAIALGGFGLYQLWVGFQALGLFA